MTAQIGANQPVDITRLSTEEYTEAVWQRFLREKKAWIDKRCSGQGWDNEQKFHVSEMSSYNHSVRNGYSVWMYKDSFWIIDNESESVVSHVMFRVDQCKEIVWDNARNYDQELVDQLVNYWHPLVFVATVLRRDMPDWGRSHLFLVKQEEEYDYGRDYLLDSNPHIYDEVRKMIPARSDEFFSPMHDR